MDTTIGWVGHVLSSDAFRGGTLLAATITGIIAVVLALIKRKPQILQLEANARTALDDSTQKELKRLAAAIDQADERLDACEADRARLRSRDISQGRKIGKLEREVNGLRNQMAQLQQSAIEVLPSAGIPPATRARFRQTETAPPNLLEGPDSHNHKREP
jgi:hypothetical protein